MKNDSTVDSRVGVTLQGRYLVLERLAQGGMGVVYRGERVKLQRPVAIKFLHTWVAADQGLLKRFEVEAKAMSRLAHPHCVSVIDFGVEEGAPYLVMDFVTGQTLRELLERGPVAVDRAVALIRQVLAGLAHAHQVGIIHRDIKPENITLSDVVGAGEQVRILDFGLAKLADINTSVAGVVVGTPSYMSPEQSLGRKIDTRTDLYSTAILLFELLTGRKPFRGEQPIDVLRMHQVAPPPPLPPELNRPELEAVLHRALAKSPDDRYQTAAELSTALGAALAAAPERRAPNPSSALTVPTMATVEMPSSMIEILPGTSSPDVAAAAGPAEVSAPMPSLVTRAPGRNRGPWAALAVGVVALVAGGLWWSQGSSHAPTPDPSLTTSPPAAPLPPTTAAPPPAPAPTVVAATTETAPVAPPTAPVQPTPVPAPTTATGPRDAADIPGLAALEAKLDKPRQRVGAIKGLIHLRSVYPANAHLALTLGHAYMESLWWSDGLAAYSDAIRLDATYRLNPTLLRNCVRALISDKLAGRVASFIEHSLGAAALPYLEETIRTTKNAKVHQRATRLAARLSSKG